MTSARPLCFVVNSIGDVVPSMATFMLMRAAVARGHSICVVGVDDLGVDAGASLWGLSSTVEQSDDKLTVAALRAAPRTWRCLDDCAALIFRTNPARDPHGAHGTALAIGRMARDRGIVVVNDPDGLVRASSKLYLTELPAGCRPETEVARDPERLLSFVERAKGRCVLKPLSGTRGRDVFMVESGGSNLRQIAEVVTRDGYGMVQRFVPEAAGGDVRVVVMDGEVLEIDGAALAVRRVPAKTDFRSNIHTGGHAEPAEVDQRMREVVAAAAPLLKRDGLFLCGLDFIGGVLVELNVYATGGFRDAERYYQRDFSGAVIGAIEQRVAATVAG